MKRYFVLVALVLPLLLLISCAPTSFHHKKKSHSKLSIPKAHHVALLLPLSGSFSRAGDAVLAGYQAAAAKSANQPTMKIYDTALLNVQAAYHQAIDEGADFIVGPLDKSAVQKLAQASSLKLPVLALNTLETQSPAKLFQFNLSPQLETEQIARQAYQDGYHQAVILTPRGNWGHSIADRFRKQFLELGGEVIAETHYTQRDDLDFAARSAASYSADMIFMVAYPTMARQIVPLLKFHQANAKKIYALSISFAGKTDTERDKDLDGVTFCDMPWMLKDGQVTQSRYLSSHGAWPEPMNIYARLYALGMDAFTLTQQLSLLAQGQSIQGYTGELELEKFNHVIRQLSCAEFNDGVTQATFSSPLNLSQSIAAPVKTSSTTANTLIEDKDEELDTSLSLSGDPLLKDGLIDAEDRTAD